MNKEEPYYSKKAAIIGFLIMIAVFATMVVPLPYYIETPGSADSLADYVTVGDKKDEFSGSFMLTTVSVRRANAISLVISLFQKNSEIVSKKDMVGDSNHREYEEMQSYFMKSSQNYATKVGLDLADKPYELSYQGIHVMSVEAYSDFKGKLEMGDIITGINGHTLTSSKELLEMIEEQQNGEVLEVAYLRHNKANTVSGYLVPLPDTARNGIGISFVDETSIDSNPNIHFSTEGIGGPSAGLMFTLEIYGLLTNQDLRQGRNIAGTGTISVDGEVGRIGGIDKKVVAAEEAGASIFFAPNDPIEPELKAKHPELLSNYEEALASVEKNKLQLTIVPVTHVEDAISYLNKK